MNYAVQESVAFGMYWGYDDYRSGYYHQTSERFFPKWLGNYEDETGRERCLSSALNGTSDMPITAMDDSTMVEKTVEVCVVITCEYRLTIVKKQFPRIECPV